MSAWHSSTRATRARRTARITALVLPIACVGSLLAASPAQASATSRQFAALRMCESGGDYSINTGNGFYGAYQFSEQTWLGMGMTGLPSNAAPAVQDAAAERLQAARGWEPWPACAARLDLYNSALWGGTPAPAPAAPTTHTTTTATAHVAAAAVSAPAVVASAPEAPAPVVLTPATLARAVEPSVVRSLSRLHLGRWIVGHAAHTR